MSSTIEQRLDKLVHELIEIKKEMIMQKMQPAVGTFNKISVWKSLGKKISVSWDHVSAVDEIRQQRDTL